MVSQARPAAVTTGSPPPACRDRAQGRKQNEICRAIRRNAEDCRQRAEKVDATTDAPKAKKKMKELRRFSARPWTEADDDKLRALALTGASSRAIGMQMDRTEVAVRSRASRLKIIVEKSKRGGFWHGLKAKK